MASELNKRDEESQVNTLIYSMGDEADDILQSFGLSDADRKKYKSVKDKFEGHFIIKKKCDIRKSPIQHVCSGRG